MRIAVIVQARLSSQRLPGKVLLDLGGAPVLERMLERVRAASTPFETIVATSFDASCDEIAALCRRCDVRCFRGHPLDLLDRHVQAAREVDADIVVKIPSDCPLIDPRIIDRVLRAYLERHGQVDFVSNLHPPSYPDGNDVEVMTRDVIETAAAEAVKDYEREHTTPFIWDRPERFRLHNVTWEKGVDYSQQFRLTLDYIHDYRLINAVYAALYRPAGAPFSLAEILAFLEDNPDVRRLNQRWLGAGWQRAHLSEFSNAAALGTLGAAHTTSTTVGDS
jgi:spore coat polysaccharide biosynthesis protein SpsF